jgi:tetratricopeptide (TPR) repeat protein
MRPEPTRGKVIVTGVASAAIAGAAGWLLLGPLWTIAGVVAGPPVTLLGYAVVRTSRNTDPAVHLNNHEPHLALAELDRSLESLRFSARLWPGQFRDPLALYLLLRAEALQELGREAQALAPAAEAVGIYQVLAAEKPRKFTPGLAAALDRQARLLAAADRLAEAVAAAEVAVRLYRNLAASAPGTYLPDLACSLTGQARWLSDMDLAGPALAAAAEAAVICQDQLPAADMPSCAAEALLLKGRLLTGQDRYSEAVRPLAAGWQLAAGQRRPGLLSSATPALRAVYRADQAALARAWRAETGHDPPDWLAE